MEGNTFCKHHSCILLVRSAAEAAVQQPFQVIRCVTEGLIFFFSCRPSLDHSRFSFNAFVCAVILQVLCVGNLYNPDVRYSFNIPIEEHREQFVWDPSGSWLECSRACQGATSHRHTTSLYLFKSKISLRLYLFVLLRYYPHF